MAATEIPSRSLTNKSADEDAILGEDTSEVRTAVGQRKDRY